MIANGARFLGPIKYKSRFAGPKRAADTEMVERFGYTGIPTFPQF